MQATIVSSAEWPRRFFRHESRSNCEVAFCRNVQTGTFHGPLYLDQDNPALLSFCLQNNHHQANPRAIAGSVLRRERSLIAAVDRVVNEGRIAEADASAIASLFSLYVSGYPDLFGYPVNCERYFVNFLHDAPQFRTHTEFNAYLYWTGFRRAMSVSAVEFSSCKYASVEDIDSAIDLILTARDLRPIKDVRTCLLGEFVSPSSLLKLRWELLTAENDPFILSDRPVPPLIVESRFAVALSPRYALLFTQSDGHGERTSRAATADEVCSVNTELRQRATKWVLGPAAENL